MLDVDCQVPKNACRHKSAVNCASARVKTQRRRPTVKANKTVRIDVIGGGRPEADDLANWVLGEPRLQAVLSKSGALTVQLNSRRKRELLASRLVAWLARQQSTIFLQIIGPTGVAQLRQGRTVKEARRRLERFIVVDVSGQGIDSTFRVSHIADAAVTVLSVAPLQLPGAVLHAVDAI